jgi:hypothetical protein
MTSMSDTPYCQYYWPHLYGSVQHACNWNIKRASIFHYLGKTKQLMSLSPYQACGQEASLRYSSEYMYENCHRVFACSFKDLQIAVTMVSVQLTRHHCVFFFLDQYHYKSYCTYDNLVRPVQKLYYLPEIRLTTSDLDATTILLTLICKLPKI